MAYIAPITWTAGQVPTHTDFNEQIKGNIEFLKTPTQDRLANQATTNTTSTSFVNITGVTLTIATNAAKVLVLFQGGVASSAALTADLTITVDGTNAGDASRGLATIVATGILSYPTTLAYRTEALTAASHTFRVQWKTSTGTITLQAGWAFSVIEFG